MVHWQWLFASAHYSSEVLPTDTILRKFLDYSPFPSTLNPLHLTLNCSSSFFFSLFAAVGSVCTHTLDTIQISALKER